MALKPYLQLVRLPNVFTAAADSLAGWLLVVGSFENPRLVLLVFASACTYAGGIALNDVFDAEVDRAERPTRPIPSGRVSRRSAALLGSGLMALGFVWALASGARYAWVVELVLIGAVLLYDTAGKRSFLGPEVMGACRSLNFLLGMSATLPNVGEFAVIAVVSYGLFVTGVTWISRSEVLFGRQMTVLFGAVLQNLAIAGLMFAGFVAGIFKDPEFRGKTLEALVAGELLLIGIGLVLIYRNFQALRRPEPSVTQRAVKLAIMSLVWLHVGLLLAVRGPIEAGAVALLWFPAVYAGRWIYST